MPHFDDRIADLLERGTLEQGARGHPLLLVPEYVKGEEPSHCLAFHFAMWLLANPKVTNFRVLLDGAANRSPVVNTLVNIRFMATWVVFGERNDYTAFTRWLRIYRTWFTGRPIEAAFFPEFPTSGRMTLSFVKFDVAKELSPTTYVPEYPNALFDAWAWVIEHCRKPVYALPGGLAFRDTTEAMMFKLRWCG